jgi:hypothetical protein
VPATYSKFEKPLPPGVIHGSGDTKGTMPDLKAVDACAAGKNPGNDADVYWMSALSCMETAPMSAAPVPIKATARITLLLSDDGKSLDPMVEMKITYLDKSASPDGTMVIDFAPKGCKIVPQTQN